MKQKITGTPNKIQFYYYVDDIFDPVSMRSLYRAKKIKTEGGVEQAIDEYAIQEDERSPFNEFLKIAIYDAFNYVKKMTKNVDNALFVFVTGTEASVSQSDDVVGFYVEDKAAYNENVLDIVDKNIKEYLKVSVLLQWYLNTGVDDEAAKMQAQLQSWVNKLMDSLFQLRIPLMS